MKVVFIVSSIVNPNTIKRINALTDEGFEVIAYGYGRNMKLHNTPKKVKIINIGEINNSSRYLTRLKEIRKSIKQVVRYEEKEGPCIFYLVGLEVAMTFRSLTDHKYFYEEADIVHANMKSQIMRFIFEKIDLYIVRHSVLSVFRSAGFLKYHFGENIPKNVMAMPNKLSNEIVDIPIIQSKPYTQEKISIGFVGGIRYNSIFNFAKVFTENFPEHEFHFFGAFASQKAEEQFSKLKRGNCFFHGPFTSPVDLPQIYSKIDLVLATYDIEQDNVKYAEPNKLYEAIYFDTPIIVTSGTYVSQRVRDLNIGYCIDPMNRESIKSFIKSLSKDSVYEKIKSIRTIDKKTVINNNSDYIKIKDEIYKAF